MPNKWKHVTGKILSMDVVSGTSKGYFVVVTHLTDGSIWRKNEPFDLEHESYRTPWIRIDNLEGDEND